MKHRTKLLTTLGVVAALSVGGYAAYAHASGDYHGRFGGQERHFGGGEHGGKRMMRMLERYDTNGDGALTKDEVLGARAEQFKKFDSDGDGMLTLDEYQGLWMDAMRERMVDRFQQHDDDGDGKISAEDFSERYGRMMTWMDRNEDGKIDRDDMRRGYRKDD